MSTANFQYSQTYHSTQVWFKNRRAKCRQQQKQQETTKGSAGSGGSGSSSAVTQPTSNTSNGTSSSTPPTSTPTNKPVIKKKQEDHGSSTTSTGSSPPYKDYKDYSKSAATPLWSPVSDPLASSCMQRTTYMPPPSAAYSTHGTASPYAPCNSYYAPQTGMDYMNGAGQQCSPNMYHSPAPAPAMPNAYFAPRTPDSGMIVEHHTSTSSPSPSLVTWSSNATPKFQML